MSEKFQLKGCIHEPSLDVPPNWRDMRSEFGYKLLGKIRYKNYDIPATRQI